MPGFDVLSEDLTLFENHFIEASAGTGKTFTIENIVLRLLSEGISLDEILIVTFTKAATFELKRRIKKAIENTLKNNDLSYLLRKKYLRSLSLFDECQIQTIHGFCTYALFSDSLEDQDKESKYEVLIQMVKDYFRTELHQFGTFQLDKILRNYQYDIDQLIKDLLKVAKSRIPIVCGRSYHDLKRDVFRELNSLRNEFNIVPDNLFQDLVQQASCFKEMSNRQKEIKKEVEEELKRFCQLFIEENELSFTFIQEMKEENKLKRGLKEASLNYPKNYPGFLERLQKNIFPALESIQDNLFIFATLAEGIRQHLLNKKDILLHDDLLLMMEKKVKEGDFANKIRGKYKAVLIDEFQDTDHLQWNIFSNLFNEKDFQGTLYVVGDPKQSIYRFRGADIYTYFQAKKSFKPKSHKTLIRNYRSEPNLVKALNYLFSFLNPFLTLPKTNEAVLCQKMDWDPKKISTDWQDGKGSIHFIEGEEEDHFFEFIIDEIKKLQIPLRDCAVLVKDRFQAERFKKFAKQKNIHAVTRKSRPITSTTAFVVLKDLLENLLHIRRKGAIEKILAGPLFAFDIQMIEERIEEESIKFSQLKLTLEKEGILSFFKKLNNEDFFVGLISREGGIELYADLLQLVEILQEKSAKDEYLETLKKLTKLECDDESIQTYNVGLDEGIPLYTIHGSKGLEFEIVFALGLAFSSQEKKDLIFDPEKRVFTYSKEAFEQEKLELQAEKIRLFYVAATRAKKRLYLPYIKKDKKSPINVFLERARLENFKISQITHSKYESDIKHEEIKAFDPPLLYEPETLQFNIQPIVVSSYSKMSSSHNGEPIIYPDNILPPGKETGILLHKILDEFPFEKAKDIKTAEEITPFFWSRIENTPLKAWEKEISQIMFNVFHVSLPFTLASVDPKKIMKEMEFLYFSTSQNCYLKGFIDFIFEYEGKIYFIDWKSNYLEDYSPLALEKALKDSSYFLQNEIYKEAITHYASLFSIPFGGSYYIFLRGIAMNSVNGIFFNKT